MLIDKALAVRGYVLLPLAAPHHRRDGLVFGRPSAKRASDRGPLPAAVEATTACPMSARRRSRMDNTVVEGLGAATSGRPVTGIRAQYHRIPGVGRMMIVAPLNARTTEDVSTVRLRASLRPDYGHLPQARTWPRGTDLGSAG